MEPTSRNPARTTGEAALQAILNFNAELDGFATDRLVNEAVIVKYLGKLQSVVSAQVPCFWLLMARLTELAVVCAGRYADACEFAAAGDLLVNPREIRVHFKGARPASVLKRRRGSLVLQCNTARRPQADFIQWFKTSATVEIVQAPLLPFLTEMLTASELLPPFYLEKIENRLGRIADTLGFLGSWQVEDAADLHRRLSAAPPETRAFVSSHLCDFDLNLFHLLGSAVRQLALDPVASSDFLDPAAFRPWPADGGRMPAVQAFRRDDGLGRCQ